MLERGAQFEVRTDAEDRFEQQGEAGRGVVRSPGGALDALPGRVSAPLR
ncbi:hypothetical protein ACFUJ0_24160 [Streptomyces sp. NPDC057242]